MSSRRRPSAAARSSRSRRSRRSTISPVRLVAVAVAVSAGLALLAAGCGGGKSSEEKWASSVCTNIANWKQQIQKEVNDARAALQSPKAGTMEAIKADVQQA